MEFSDYELNEMLEEAALSGAIDASSAAYGIARLCIDNGYQALTDAQKRVYDRHVAPHLKKAASRREADDRQRGMPD